MPLKIIKKGSTGTLRVQKYSFSDPHAAHAVESTPVPSWMGGVSSNAPPNSLVDPQEVGTSGLQFGMDSARVEKAAYESGFRQGEKAGMEIAEKKVDVLMRRYSEAIMELGRLRPKLFAEVEREVVKLAIEVAKKIVHREIQIDPQIIQTLVRVALTHVAEKSAVTVHLHPADYNYLLERRGELLSGAASGREIVLLADKSIERGGCTIQTECGDVDARIEEEFREVERGFFEGNK